MRRFEKILKPVVMSKKYKLNTLKKYTLKKFSNNIFRTVYKRYFMSIKQHNNTMK